MKKFLTIAILSLGTVMGANAQYDENTENGEVRAAYGTLGSCVGILVNLLLSAGKFLVGLLSGSLAILADAANNLSDAAGSIVALVSTRMARKPVDAEHPFGHGRMEYLGSLGVGLLILVMSFTLLKDGVEAIIASAELNLSWPVLAVLAVSILVKTWLYFFYRRLGRATDNGTLLAASKDSLSDVWATGAVLLSTIVTLALGWPVDGYMGVLVSLLVLSAAWSVLKETVTRLLGGAPDTFLGAGIQTARRLIDAGFIGNVVGTAAFTSHLSEFTAPSDRGSYSSSTFNEEDPAGYLADVDADDRAAGLHQYKAQRVHITSGGVDHQDAEGRGDAAKRQQASRGGNCPKQ